MGRKAWQRRIRGLQMRLAEGVGEGDEGERREWASHAPDRVVQQQPGVARAPRVAHARMGLDDYVTDAKEMEACAEGDALRQPSRRAGSRIAPTFSLHLACMQIHGHVHMDMEPEYMYTKGNKCIFQMRTQVA